MPAWLAFFEPDGRLTPRLGVAVDAPSAVAGGDSRRAVGLAEEPGVLIMRVKPGSPVFFFFVIYFVRLRIAIAS